MNRPQGSILVRPNPHGTKGITSTVPFNPIIKKD